MKLDEEKKKMDSTVTANDQKELSFWNLSSFFNENLWHLPWLNTSQNWKFFNTSDSVQ